MSYQFRESRSPERARWPSDSIPAWAHPTSNHYLHDRGLSDDEIRKFALGFSESGYWKNRILIPMYDNDDQIISIQGRSIDDSPPRYLTQGPRWLYKPWALHELNGGPRRLVIVEGPFDLFAVSRVHPLVVATLGTMISPQQLTAILALPIQAISIFFDREAIMEAYDLQRKLQPSKPTDVIIQDSAKDPGELNDTDLRSALDQAAH